MTRYEYFMREILAERYPVPPTQTREWLWGVQTRRSIWQPVGTQARQCVAEALAIETWRKEQSV